MHLISTDKQNWTKAGSHAFLFEAGESGDSVSSPSPTSASAPPALPLAARSQASHPQEDIAGVTAAPPSGRNSRQRWEYGTPTGSAGPVSGTEMLRLARKGVVLPETMVRKEGTEDWRVAEDIPALQEVFDAPSEEVAEPATHGARLGAFFLDMAILLPFVGPLAYISYAKPGASFLFVPTCLLVPIYKILMEALLAATLGKLVFRILIVKEENLEPCGPGAAFLRNCILVLSAGFGCLAFLGIQSTATGIVFLAVLASHFAGSGFCLFTERHRALQDFMAGTVCIVTTPDPQE